jgi:predicted nuclease of restriction endonuclease-like (RecB) superfamily
MRAFAEAWPEGEFVQQLVAQLPWGHNVRLLDHLKTRQEREWYVHKAIEHGWSRPVLEHQIESGLYYDETSIPASLEQWCVAASQVMEMLDTAKADGAIL